ncbi:MAG TPA: hypothetical protein VFT47_21575 [Vicinamibacterales bacterium]|nr:hypothetical protein [Vicinamibacterales bacterium]
MRHLRAAVLLLSCVYAACAMTTATQGSDDASRRDFLARVDAWLAARDAAKLAAAADADAWLASGRATLLPGDLWLPPAPIVRIDPADDRPRSPNEALYRDGDGNKWRLRIRWDEKNGWVIPVRPDPCQGGASREGFRDLPERGGGQATAPAASAKRWTPLECYPFKR